MFWLITLLLPFLAFAVPAPEGRGSSAPFVSGDSFRAFADFVFDELDRSLDPASVASGSVVFVKPDYLDEFFARVHPRICARYILLTHNADHAVPGPYASFLDDERIIAWFGQNYDGTPHPKMHPIPIGLANSHWRHGDFGAVDRVAKEALSKSHVVYMNIAVETFREERWRVFRHFAAAPYCYRAPKKDYDGFLRDVASSQFVVAPRGNGLDTHRLWEALYLGSIPIVKSSSLDGLYREFPVLIVNDWGHVTERFLRERCREMMRHPWPYEKLRIEYWIKRINAYRNQ